MDDDRYRAPALDKGLDILELLSEIDGALTQAEIGKALGRGPNEFYRMLDRLVRRGYVARTEDDRYTLTLKLFSYAHLHPPTRRLASLATPLMRELANITLQANHLAVFDRGSVVVVAQREAPDYTGISVRVGSRVNLYQTGSGHVLLAFRSNTERLMMIGENQRSDNPATGPDDVFELLDAIAKRGYERMPSAQMRGVYNLSVPVLGPGETAIAALTIPFIELIDKPQAPDMKATLSLLRETADRLANLAGLQHGLQPAA